MRKLRTSPLAVLMLSAPLPGQTLKQVAAIDLPGPKGQRFDYLTVDDEDHFLLSAHLGPGILYVIDMRTNKLVKAIPGVPGITGLEFVPGARKVYTSDWGEEKIAVVDLHSMSVNKAPGDRVEAQWERICRPVSQGVCLQYSGKSRDGRGRR
jgi:DNA-binding beta-propeller fold protein YncE